MYTLEQIKRAFVKMYEEREWNFDWFEGDWTIFLIALQNQEQKTKDEADGYLPGRATGEA